MTSDDYKLLTKSTYTGLSLVKVGNGILLPISNVGHSTVSTPVRALCLSHIFHVPLLRHTLLSVRQLCTNNNCSVIFYSTSVRVKDNTTSDVLLQAPSVGKCLTGLFFC